MIFMYIFKEVKSMYRNKVPIGTKTNRKGTCGCGTTSACLRTNMHSSYFRSVVGIVAYPRRFGKGFLKFL